MSQLSGKASFVMRARPSRGAALGSAIALLAALSWASPARAALQRDAAAAEALFQAARAEADKGNWASACAKFRESHALEPAPGTAYHLADCEEHLGNVATAWAMYEEARQRLAPGDKRVNLIKERLAALEKRLPRLMVKLAAGAPSGTRVSRDGVALGAGSLGTSLPVDPGKHVLIASAPGYEDKTLTFEIREGEKKELSVEPGPVKAREEGAKPDEGGTSALRIAGFSALGLGVAGVAVAAITGGILLDRNATLKTECPGDRCSPAGTEILNGSDGLFAANYAGWIAGAVGLGAGAALLIVSMSTSGAKPERTIGFAPVILPGTNGFVMRGSF